MSALKRLFIFILLFCAAGWGQQASGEKQQVKINYLNVCLPGDDDQQALKAALGRLPAHPRFAPDFEIARGRTSQSDAGLKIAGAEEAPAQQGPASWVRVRREYSADSPLVSAQYSMSVDEKAVNETLVFRSRELKDVIQTTLEDSVSAASDPAQVLNSNTPVERIRLERFGKPSIVLARCPGADQTKYEPIFQQASGVMAGYRTLLGVRETVPADLRRLGVGAVSHKAPHSEKPKTK